MDLQKFRAGAAKWFENAKSQATVAPSKGQLLAWLLLVSFINVTHFRVSELSSTCDFERTESHLGEVEAKLDLLELKINNLTLYARFPKFAESDQEYRKVADNYEQEMERSLKAMKYISTQIEDVCDEAAMGNFWMYVVATIAALFLAWATLNADNKTVTKRKPKPKPKASPPA